MPSSSLYRFLMAALLWVGVALPADAVYVQRFNGITNGAVTFTGNTLGLNKNNGNSPGTNGSLGTFISLAGTGVDGGFPTGTTSDWRLNGSAAQLDLPANSTVLYAELVWSGSYSYGGENVQSNLNEAVTFITPNGQTSVSPDPATAVRLGTPNNSGGCSTGPCFYVRSANVTTLVRAAGGGTYRAGGIPATQATGDQSNNTGGWTLAVVYQNAALPSRNLTVFVGAEVTNNTTTTTASVTGFCTPNSVTQSGRLLISTLEGDNHLNGDQLQFGPNVAGLTPISGPNNALNNFFASRINGDDGNINTSGSFGTSNPPSAGARQGYDITNVDVSGLLNSNQQSAVARGTTTGDQYVINALGLQIQVGAPIFPITVKTVDKPITFVGDVLTYTITLNNGQGTADAINTLYRDAIQSGLTFVPNTFTINGVVQPGADPNVGVPIGTIRAGASVRVSYQVTVDSIPAQPKPASYTESSAWTYQFISCAGQPISNGAITTNPVTSSLPRLALTKSVNPTGAVLAGQTLTYTMTATNDGLAPSNGTTLADGIPSGTTYVPGSTTLNGVAIADLNGTMPFATPALINSPGEANGQVMNGEAAVVSFQVTVNNNFSGTVRNVATADVDGPGRAPSVSAEAVNTSALRPLLSINKEAVGSFVRGARGTFVLLVSNGATPAAGATVGSAVTVSDTLPDGLRLASVPTGSGWGCQANGNAFTCVRSDILPAGQSYPPITLNVDVLQSASGTLTNTASVVGGGDDSPASDDAVVTIDANADLLVTKVASNPNPSIGQNVTFTLLTRNLGPSDASNTQVADLLPAGLTFVSSSATRGAYDNTTGTWSLGDLPLNAEGQLNIIATFNGPGQVTNVATVSANEPDPNPANNSDSLTIPTQTADLSLTKSVDNATPSVGSNVEFRLATRNAGPADATGVAATDQLPAGLTFVSATASQGTYDNDTGVWTIGNLANGANATLAITATVNNAIASINSAQITAADQFDPNSMPNNNDPTENDQGSASVTPLAADLAAAKSVDRNNPNISDIVEFTIAATNQGPGNAPDVVVADVLPAGLTFVSAVASQGSYSSTTGNWTVGAVNVGATPTLRIRATFDGPGQVTNTATVSSPLPDPNPSNNNASIAVPSQIADLSLSKSISDPAPNFGDVLTFTLITANAGPNTATNVRIEDRLPSGLTFVSSTPSQGTYDAANGFWSVGSIAANTTANLTIRARVDSNLPLTNTAQVAASDQFDPNSTPNNSDPSEDDQGSVSISPQSADLAVAKGVDDENPNVGDVVTFTLTAINNGPTAAQSAQVVDPLPAGLVLISATPSVGSFDSTSGTWSIGSFAPNGSATLLIRATFNGPVVTNVAQISSATPDPNPSNNSAQLTIPAQVADLSLSKTVGEANPAVGATVAFTITVANNGPNNATNVSVADVLPSGLSFVSASASQGSYAAGVGSWFVGTLNNGASQTLTINATVTGKNPITNTAQVASSDQFDPNSTPGNNSGAENDQASVTINPQSADLAVAKSVDNPSPNIGDSVNFTLNVTNLGPTAAQAVVVNDLLPSGLTFVGATTNNGSYDDAQGRWTIGTLNPSQIAALQITATFSGPNQVTNRATVSADTPDGNLANNTAEVTVPSQVADLTLTKATSNATPVVNGMVSFTIGITNAGPSTATNVNVADQIPAGLEFVSSTVSQGGYNPNTGTWQVGSLLSGGSATLTLNTMVTGRDPITNVAQVIGSDQFDPNSIPNNSDAGEDDQASVSLVPQIADLSLSKSTSNASPIVGTEFDFSLVVNNNGPTAAQSVAVNDVLPPGLAFVSSSAAQGAYDVTTGFWLIGTLPTGASATLSMRVRFDGPGQQTNLATVSSTTPDPVDSNNSAQVRVPSQIADLSLTKSIDQSAPSVGNNVSFRLSLTNAGPSNATNVVVADLLPTGLNFVSANASSGAYSAVSGQWTAGTINTGVTATLDIVATVTGNEAITNTAQIAGSDQFDPNSTPGNSDPTENDQASVTLTPQLADLAVAKSVDNPSPIIGQNVLFRLIVINNGPTAAQSVEVTDPLPTGLTFVSATAPGGTSYDANTGLWTIGTLNAAQTQSLEITARFDGPGQVTNIATVSSATPDPNEGNNQANISVPSQIADLALSKSVSDAMPSVGSGIVYTIAVSNLGPADATNVSVNEVIPVGLALLSATVSQGSYNSDTGLWTLGNLSNGSNATLVIGATVIGTAPITNTAQIASADQFDPNSIPNNNASSENDQASVTIVPQNADLATAKTVSNPNPNNGDQITYTITVRNDGPGTATNVNANDVLPAGLTFVSATASQGTYDNTTGAWPIGTLNAGANATLQIVSGFNGTQSTNVASVTSDVPDPDTSNNSGRVTVPSQLADITLSKTVSTTTPNVGQDVTFTVTAANAGPNTATRINIADSLPEGLTYVSHNASVGTYVPGTGAWSIASLAGGANATLSIVATVAVNSSLTNTAEVIGLDQFDPDSVPNNGNVAEDDQASVTLTPQSADVAITKTVNIANPTINTNVTFRISVTNNGPTTAQDVVVNDLLPTGLTFVNATPSAGTYDSGSGRWTVGALSAAQTQTLDVIATFAGPGIATNRASVSSSTSDSNPSNNTAQVSVPWQIANLSLTKAVDVPSPAVGSNVVFTITLSNAGPSAATNISVGDPLPAGLSFLSATPSTGSYNNTTGAWMVPTLAAGATATLNITATFNGGAATTNTAQVTASDQFDPNSTPNNNNPNEDDQASVSLGQPGSIAGSIWLDSGANRRRESEERGLENWIVELLSSDGSSVVASVRTDAEGRYELEGIPPGNYQLRFRDPESNIIFGTPSNGEQGNPQPGSSVAPNRDALVITLGSGESKIEQGLPVDPSGVLYDSVAREPVPGGVVTFCGPAGFDAEAQLVGGSSYQDVVGRPECAAMTVGSEGIYQFLLTPGAPAGNYTIEVDPPEGFRNSTSIPAEANALIPPAGPGVFAVQPQTTPPPVGQSTRYFLALNLSGNSADVVNNHIPLDSAIPSILQVSKTASAASAEIGESVAYEIRVENLQGPNLPLLQVTDRLPAGFRYLEGSARLIRDDGVLTALTDPQGGVGPVLTFNIAAPSGASAALPSGESVSIRYRVRLDVGSQQGDGINRATASSGFVQSNEAQARVIVDGGVFASEACVIGKIYLDCNENRVQDHEELGVPGVRMYFEDGTYLESDVEGKYSLCGLRPITHVLKVDDTTLPAGAWLGTVDNRNAGDADSRFVDLRNGELHRADFNIRNCSTEVMEGVKERRKHGEVERAGDPHCTTDNCPRSLPDDPTTGAQAQEEVQQ